MWFENFLDACGRFYDRERLIALPYDAAVANTFYRKDVFEANSKDFESEYGYRMEFNEDTTWKNVMEFSAFLKKRRESGKDVPYGYAQHHGTFAWTTQLDIQRMMFAHGRWLDWEIDDKLGSKTPPPSNWGDEQSVLLMQKHKDIADVSHPDNLANGTLELNTVYQAGDIAMQVQYHEFAASIEDEKPSKAAGGRTAMLLVRRASQAGSLMAVRLLMVPTVVSAASASMVMPARIFSAQLISSVCMQPRQISSTMF